MWACVYFSLEVGCALLCNCTITVARLPVVLVGNVWGPQLLVLKPSTDTLGLVFSRSSIRPGCRRRNCLAGISADTPVATATLKHSMEVGSRARCMLQAISAIALHAQ